MGILDNNDWQPDLDFFVELYDPDKPGQPRHAGDDTRCVVTILDEDLPGTLSFGDTAMTINKGTEQVHLTITRRDGSDGRISCVVDTEPMLADGGPDNAEELVDYVPMHEKVTFENGENEKTITIRLVTDEGKGDGKGTDGPDGQDDAGKDDASSEPGDKLFKVRIGHPDPEGLKISKKNVCFVTIHQGEADDAGDKQAKLIRFFMGSRDRTFGS